VPEGVRPEAACAPGGVRPEAACCVRYIAGATSEAALRERRRRSKLLVRVLRGELLIRLRRDLHGAGVSKPRWAKCCSLRPGCRPLGRVAVRFRVLSSASSAGSPLFLCFVFLCAEEAC
jgi:hypothetical protein